MKIYMRSCKNMQPQDNGKARQPLHHRLKLAFLGAPGLHTQWSSVVRYCQHLRLEFMHQWVSLKTNKGIGGSWLRLTIQQKWEATSNGLKSLQTVYKSKPKTRTVGQCWCLRKGLSHHDSSTHTHSFSCYLVFSDWRISISFSVSVLHF